MNDVTRTYDLEQIEREVTPEVRIETTDNSDNVIVEDFVVMDGILEMIHKEDVNTTELPVLPGTLVVFRNEGSLFPGKLVSASYPYYIIAAMNKCMDGCWRWPTPKDIIKINHADLITKN